MTFYEAAIQILLREGRPLHAREITEKALEENLLSHVGKQPEVVMASRLAAMARRSHDKRLVAVEPDVFGLSDWSIEATPEALEQSGLPLVPEEALQPPLRDRERHPRVSKENVRLQGRGERRRREEIQRRRKRVPQALPELVLEVLRLVEAPLPLFELAASLRERDLVEDDLGREALEARLREDDRRREKEGEEPTFAFFDGGWVGLAGSEAPEEGADPLPKLEEAMARLSRGKRPKAPPAAAEPTFASLERLVSDNRQAAVRQLRKKLGELEGDGLGAITQSLLDSMGYRDVRVAKRHREGALLTAKRRMGLLEVRYAIRVLRGGRDVLREDVSELRKDLQSHSAQMGVLVSPADPTREARSEASAAGQGLVLLLCADALAEQLVERGIGTASRTVTLVEYDPVAIASLVGKAAPSKARRETSEERKERREKERQEWRERRQKAREERAAKRKAEADAAADEKEAPPGEPVQAPAVASPPETPPAPSPDEGGAPMVSTADDVAKPLDEEAKGS